MASTDDIKTAIGCLSTVYPQFVSKEMAHLTDGIVAAVQGFTDPLAAIGDLNIDSIINGVAELSEGDALSSIAGVAVGLSSQYVGREASAVLEAKVLSSGTAKRIQQVQNFSEGLINAGITMMSLFTDLPYAAAQKMCRTISRLDELKKENLRCLRKHIVQLTNAILVLVENKTTYKDDTLADLQLARDKIVEADTELGKSQPVKGGVVGFDQKAFERAREALILASRLLTPDMDGTSILDAVDILTSGSVEAGQVNRANASLIHLTIPSLTNLIEIEVAAVVSQVEVINFYIDQLGGLIADYRNTGSTSKIKAQRARAITEIKSRLVEISEAMQLAIDRGSITAASGNMLLWSSRVKAMIVSMDELNELTLQEGSMEGPDKAYALEQAFQQLLTDLTDINVSVTIGGVPTVVVENGIEDPLQLRDKVLSIVKVTRKIVSDLEGDKISANKIATLHQLAAQVASEQIDFVDQSSSVASQQIVICDEFAAIELQTSERYEELLDSMRQVGLDRAVDLLGSGQFSAFLESDLSTLSYIGAAADCLKNALDGIDDVQTRQGIADIRDDMVARRSNSDLAAADSADQGRLRFINKVKKDIATIQKNAKTVEAIVADLTVILENAGGLLEESFGQVTSFLGNLDHLSVGGGGRLGPTVEEYSDHPNAGVVKCEAT